MYMEPLSGYTVAGRAAAVLDDGAIKTILVPVSGSETDRVVLSAAWAIAQPLQAHLEFLHLRLKPEEAAARSPYVDISRSRATLDALRQLALEQANLSASAANYVRQFCLEHGIAFRDTRSGTAGLSADCLEDSGPGAARLLFHARHSDLTMLGRAPCAEWTPIVDRSKERSASIAGNGCCGLERIRCFRPRHRGGVTSIAARPACGDHQCGRGQFAGSGSLGQCASAARLARGYCRNTASGGWHSHCRDALTQSSCRLERGSTRDRRVRTFASA